MANLKTSPKVRAGSIAANRIYAGSSLVWQAAAMPTMEYWFDFDGGTIGNSPTTSDVFGIPFHGASSVGLTYATPGKNSDTCVATAAGSGSGLLQWNNPSAVTSAALGFWFKPDIPPPSGEARLADFRQTASAGTVGGVIWNASGRFLIMQGTVAIVAGQSPVMPVDVWYWISLHWDATAKLARLTIHDADGVSLHDSGPIALTTSYTSFTTTRMGRVTINDIGVSAFDMLQFDPGATAPIPPWMAVAPPIEEPEPEPLVGPLPIGEAVYDIPVGSIFVATTGNDTTGDGTENAPYRTAAKALTMAVSGQTIVMRGGEYHEGSEPNLAWPIGLSFNTGQENCVLQNYPGEAVWFDGSSVVTGWVTHSTGIWKKTGWTVQTYYARDYSSSLTNDGGFVDNVNYPAAHMPDQLFVDGIPLQQVTSLGAVVAGTFYVDNAADVVYMGQDPAGKTIRMSDLGLMMSVRAAGVKVRGIGIRRYAVALNYLGAIRAHRPNIVFENIVSEYNATTGIGALEFATNCIIRNCAARYNGLMGLHGYRCDGLLVEYSKFDYNNQEHFNSAPSCGGHKATSTQGATYRNNTFNYNVNSPGHWLDECVYDFIIVNNNMIGNGTNGLHLEISDLGIVANNLITGNLRTQLLITSTDDVQIWNNTIAGNEHECVVFQQDNREPIGDPSNATDSRQPLSFYENECTWWMDSFVFKNNVLGESRYAPLRIKQYNYTGGSYSPLPSKGLANFGIDSDGNLFNRTYRIATTSPSVLVGAWSTGVPGTEQNSSSMTLWRSNSTAWGKSSDPNSVEIQGVGVLDANFMLTPTTVAATGSVGRPLPAEIASLIGLDTNSTVLGAQRTRPPKPSALNTGHNPATIDGEVSGTQWLNVAGMVLENKTVNGRVVVQADNVTVRNCDIRGDAVNEWLIEVRNVGCLIEDCTFNPSSPTSKVYNAVRGHNFTARRLNISRTCDGFSLYNPSGGPLNVLIEYNYVHDLYFGPDPGQGDGISHNDGVQIHGPGDAVIRYNYFEMAPCSDPAPTHSGGTSGFLVTDGASPTTSQHNLYFTDNWLTGNVGAIINLAVNTRPTTVTVARNIVDKLHPTYDPSYDILATTSVNLITPGLRATDGYDTTNGNVDSQGNQVWVERVAP